MYLSLFPRWNIPEKVIVAYSGGVDSTALLHFLKKSNRTIIALHINHGTENANKYQEWCQNECDRLNINMLIHRTQPLSKKLSKEFQWSSERHFVYTRMAEVHNCPVYLAHHLDDAVETYLMSCFCGNPDMMRPIQPNGYYRPLLLNKKQKLVDYCVAKNIQWIEDPTNTDASFGSRNGVRNNILPEVLKTYPGIHTTVKKQLLNQWNINTSLELIY